MVGARLEKAKIRGDSTGQHGVDQASGLVECWMNLMKLVPKLTSVLDWLGKFRSYLIGNSRYGSRHTLRRPDLVSTPR